MHYLLGNQIFALLLFLCMAFHFLPRSFHELLGVLLLVPFGYHLWRYHGWWRALLQGKAWQSPWGKAASLINLLLLLLMVAVFFSGVMISNHLFKDVIPLAWRMSITAHQVHKSLSYALWLLSGLHVGLHLARWLEPLLQSARSRALLLAVAVLCCGLGAYSSVLNRMGDRLLFKHIFATPALKAGPLVYLGGMLAIFTLYMAAGWLLQYLLKSPFKSNRP